MGLKTGKSGTNLTKPDPNPIVNNLYFFGTLLDSFFSLFALQTTTNFPDIMLDVYCQRRIYSLFFVGFMFVQYFLLMNMIAGVFYFNYKNVLAGSISDYTKNKKMINLVQQFVTVENFNRNEFRRIFKKYLRKPDRVPQFKRQDTILDFDNQSNSSSSTFSLVSFRPMVQKLENHRLRLREISKKVPYELFFGFIALLMAIQPIIDYELTFLQAVIMIILALISFVDHAIKIYIYGPAIFIVRKKLDFLDMVCSSLTILFISLYFFDLYKDLKILNIISGLKGVRFMGFIFRIYPYSVLWTIITNLIPFLSEVFLILFLTFYVFTIIGEFIWGGAVTLKTPVENPWPEYYPANYQYLNFNDFGGGMITLFTVLIVNNWVEVVSVFTDFIGYNKQLRFFFALFYLVGNLLSLYVLIGLVIDVAVTNLAEAAGFSSLYPFLIRIFGKKTEIQGKKKESGQRVNLFEKAKPGIFELEKGKMEFDAELRKAVKDLKDDKTQAKIQMTLTTDRTPKSQKNSEKRSSDDFSGLDESKDSGLRVSVDLEEKNKEL